MKEIKEEIKREVTDINISYEALDGTVFTSGEECLKYEETAKCVIRAKANKLITSKDKNAWEMLGGLDDHTITAFKPTSQEEADLLKQFFISECPWFNGDVHKKIREKRFDIIDKAYKNNDVVLFGMNCEDEYYFINSRQNIIDNLNSLDSESE